MNKIVKNNHVTFEIKDDVIYVFYKKHLEITIDIAKEVAEERLKISKGKDYYIIADVTNIKSSTKEAREYLADPKGGLKGIKAGAFVSKTMFSYVILNLFLKIANPGIPAKFFFKTEDAEAWIQKLKNKKQ